MLHRTSYKKGRYQFRKTYNYGYEIFILNGWVKARPRIGMKFSEQSRQAEEIIFPDMHRPPWRSTTPQLSHHHQTPDYIQFTP
jgi:hypothetical protein